MTTDIPMALLLDGEGGASELTREQLRDWAPADGLLWVDCDQNEILEMQWLTDESNISSVVLDILMAGPTRPRFTAGKTGAAIVLRGINMNPGAVPDDMVAVRIWLEPGRIITCHRRDVRSIEDVRQHLVDGDGPATPGQFLVAIADCLAGRIGASIDNIEELVAGIENDVVGGDIVDLRSTLGVVRRQAAAIRRHLAPQREAFDRLTRATDVAFLQPEIFSLREAGDRFTRQLEDLDLARENALVTQEELLNRVAQEQNSRIYLLSIVAALFLPLTFVTGLLGMNVAGLPGTNDPRAFVISCSIMLVVGLLLLAYFKYRKWI